MPATAQRGFTITELLIAMGIATFVIAVSTGVHISNLRYFRTTEGRSTIYQDSILIGNYLRGEVLGAGGGSIRGWMGVYVEDNCNARSIFPACNGSDRLTITTVSTPLQECVITGQLGPGRVQVAFTSPGVCCMQPQAAGEVTYLNRQVMMTLGDLFWQQYVTNINLATCQADLVNGQLPPAGFNALGAPPYNFTNTTMSLVNVQTFYWDSAAFTLRRFMDGNNDGVAQPGEDVIVADQVYDLQVALGYDFNVADGNLSETPTGLNDEWLHNNPTAPEAYGAGFFVAPITRSSLLQIMFGVIVGNPDTTLSLSAPNVRVLNGPVRTRNGWILQEGISRITPRNSYIFQ